MGFLAGGGSGFWNAILSYILQVKELKKLEVIDKCGGVNAASLVSRNKLYYAKKNKAFRHHHCALSETTVLHFLSKHGGAFTPPCKLAHNVLSLNKI